MDKTLLLIAALLALSACSTTTSSSSEKTGLLCIKKTDTSGEVIHCLDALTAAPDAVEERVALHNAVNKAEDHIGCVYKQKTGSRFKRWRCFYANRPDVNFDYGVGFLDLIDKGNRL